MAKQTGRGGATAKQSNRKKSESKSMQDKIINAALEEIYASVEAEQKKTSAKAPKQKKEKQPKPEVTEQAEPKAAKQAEPKAAPKKQSRKPAKKAEKPEKAAKQAEATAPAAVPAPEKPASERKTHVRKGNRKASSAAIRAGKK